MATTENNYKGSEIRLNELNKESDYEQLQRWPNDENPYASHATKDDNDTNNVYAEIETTSFDYHEDGRGTPETNSLQPLVSAQSSFNRKWLGFICVIIFGLILIITVILVVVFVMKDEANDNGNVTLKKDGHVITEVTTPTRTTPSSTFAAVWSSKTTTPTSEGNGTLMKDSHAITESTSPKTTAQSSTNITVWSSKTTPSTPERSWLSWSSWSVCSTTCGTGIQVRYRKCNQVVGCQGNYKEIQECFESICLTYGSWTTWTSWAKCDVTCGDGRQIRTRTCTKLNAADNDCVGKHTNEQKCESAICPDCSMVCESGTLNSACNMCICNQMIKGRVVSSNHAPLRNVSLRAGNAAGNVLANTDAFGEFQLANVCLNDILVFTKAGFAEMPYKINSSNTNITLTAIELPYITIEPQPKSRLIGENVTMCCSAEGTPNITYYEWFKDSKVLDERLYPNGTELLLINADGFDTGTYTCRASNTYGSVISSAVDLNVKDSSDGFCHDAYEQKRKKLPYDCIQLDTNSSSIDVGDCKPKLCRLRNNGYETNSCRDETQNCCTISDFEMLNVQCVGYRLSVLKVTSCGCGSCEISSVKILGTVLIYGSREVAKYFQVFLNGKFKTFTNSKGFFKVTVDDNSSSAVLTVFNGNVRATTKVIDLSQGTKGTLYITLYVVPTTSTVQIDPTKENNIYVGKDINDSENAVAVLHIPVNAFSDSLYRLHSAPVTLSITFLDAKNITDMDVMPGLLVHVNKNGETEYLQTFGSFRITAFNLQKTEVLSVIKEISVVIGNSITQYASETSLYKLNTVSGVWDIMSTSDGFWGVIDSLEMSSWIIIGQPETTRASCYFKVRVFEDFTLTTEVTNSRYQIFMQAVHLANRSSLETYGHSFSPSSSCFRTICSGSRGYLELWVSNMEKASDEFLLPADPAEHDDIGIVLNKQKSVQYSVKPGDEHLGLLYTNSTDGPFFNTESSCLASSDNHFKFFFRDSIENGFTLKLYFDIYSNEPDKMQYISQRVWYQKRSEGYRVCFVKVKLNTQSDKNIRVRAISYGGTNANITNEVLGIRETKLFVSSTVCIEYKCSGTIDEYFSSGEYDFTRVSIYTDKPCSVETFSQPLIDSFSEINHNNTDAGTFSFYAPTTYSPRLGVYSASTSSGDIESATTISKGECRSGNVMDYSADNPDIGVAVTFSCP